MPRLREGKRYRETRLMGIKTGVPDYVPPELELKGFKLKFYDLSDAKIGEIGADVKEGQLASAEFEFMDFGCGPFSFVLSSKPDFDIAFRTRVDIHPYYDANPWFTGFIQTIPRPGQRPPFEYIGFGFFEQLDWMLITGSYTGDEISVIIKDIIQNTIAPSTQIIYNAAKIAATAHTVTEVEFDHTYAKDAIQALTDMAKGWEFGVDNVREFYFREIETDTLYHYWAGKQFQDIKIEEDPLAVRNKLYIKSGQIQAGGTNIIGSVQNNPSISTYGLREDVVTAPDILNTADATAWAEWLLAEMKDPKVRAQIMNVLFDETKAKIDAIGKVKITVHDGTEYTLAIKRALYAISAAGTLGQLELE